jgi:hypothetical protein
MDRLDMMHEMVLNILERHLYLAPLDPAIQSALDLGTGTGIVSRDLSLWDGRNFGTDDSSGRSTLVSNLDTTLFTNLILTTTGTNIWLLADKFPSCQVGTAPRS